jgi:hypothetical protein
MLSTFTELVQDVLDRAGENPSDTSGDFYAAAQRQVVRAYRELCNKYPFLWLRASRPAVFVTVAPYTTGTVTLTAGSTTATLAPAPDAGLGSFAGRKLVPTGTALGFVRIVSHTAGAATLTLDVSWPGESGTAPFTLYQDEYTLTTPTTGASIRHLLGIYAAQDGRAIPLRSEVWLREQWPEPRQGSEHPVEAARVGMATIRLSHYPTVARRYEVPHTIYPEDLDTASTAHVPLSYRQVIADGALYFLHLMRNDNRADAAGVLFGRSVDALIVEDERLALSVHGPRMPASGPYR